MAARAIETAIRETISASAPAGNTGNFDVPTAGAPVVVYECETATSTPVVKVYVRSSAGGTWRTWRSYQRAVDVDTQTLRTPDTSITLVAGDQIIVPCPGFHSVRLDLQSGTSAALVARTSESWEEALSLTTGGAQSVVLAAGSAALGDIGLEGVSVHSFIPDGTDELLIDANARRVYGVQANTIDATPIYVKLYDKATAPAETDTPVWRGMIPANATAANGAGANFMFPMPITLTNGLGVRVVTGITDASDVAVTTAENLVNTFYSA